MIGRASLGNPNIFSQVQNKDPNSNLTFEDYLKIAKEKNLFFRHIKFQAMSFTKSIKGAKDIRRDLAKAKTIEQIQDIFNKYS